MKPLTELLDEATPEPWIVDDYNDHYSILHDQPFDPEELETREGVAIVWTGENKEKRLASTCISHKDNRAVNSHLIVELRNQAPLLMEAFTSYSNQA